MLHITAIIKTDFHSYFYRTIVLKKGTGNPLLDTTVLKQGEDHKESEKALTPVYLKRQGLGVRLDEGRQ